MPYSPKILARIAAAPRNQGSTLGRWAVRRDLSVDNISYLTGATRQTVYYWFEGRPILGPYQDPVRKLTALMSVESDPKELWRKACQQFNKPMV